MTVQVSSAVAQGVLDATETHISTSAKLKIFTGPTPVACSDADSGTLLVEMDLPSNWMADASGFSKAFEGLWRDASAVAGTAGHFRLYASDGTTCHMQGTVYQTGERGDLYLKTTAVVAGKPFVFGSFTINMSNR